MRAAAAGVAVLLALGACSNGGRAETATTTRRTTTSSTSTSTTVAPQQLPSGHFLRMTVTIKLTAQQRQIVDAYRTAWENFYRAAADPTKPHRTGAYASSSTRKVLDQYLQGLVADHQAVRIRTDNQRGIYIEGIVITANAAAVRVCWQAPAVVYRTTDGAIVSDKVTSRRFHDALTHTRGHWILDGRELEDHVPTTGSCAP